MKVLFAIKRLAATAGGAERVLCTVCSILAERGYEVVLVTFDSPGGSTFYPLDARVRRLDAGIGDSSSHARLGETWHRMRAIRQIVLEEKPNLVVGFMHSIYVPLALALVGTATPVLGSEHIVPEHYQSRRLEYLLLVLASFFLARMTVLSEAIKARYPLPVRRRMVVMPNPVEIPVGQIPPEQVKLRRVLLNVGRLEDQKDQHTLLRAFGRVAASFPDWDLRIVGDGSLRASLEMGVRELGLEGRVFLPGVTADIAAEYRAADIFALSSRYEAFGLVTAEAMSFGLPTLGFADCPGTNELIQHEQNGLLVPPGEDRTAGFAQGLARLMRDSSLRHKLGDAGRSAVLNSYATARIGDLWEKLLADVCKTSKAQMGLPTS